MAAPFLDCIPMHLRWRVGTRVRLAHGTGDSTGAAEPCRDHRRTAEGELWKQAFWSQSAAGRHASFPKITSIDSQGFCPIVKLSLFHSTTLDGASPQRWRRVTIPFRYEDEYWRARDVENWF